MFCESFPPSRAKSDRQRKQGWLTVLSFLLLAIGFILLIVWLVFFLKDIMRVQKGAEEYNDAVAEYEPSPIAHWLPGLIGEAQAILEQLPIVILGETFSVDVAFSTVLSTSLGIDDTNVVRLSSYLRKSSLHLQEGKEGVQFLNFSETTTSTISNNGEEEGSTTATTTTDSSSTDETSTTDAPTTTKLTTEPPTPYTEQIFFSFVHVALFERSPLYVKTQEEKVACPRKDKRCSNETMEVYCKSNFGALAVYKGSGCPPSASLFSGSSSDFKILSNGDYETNATMADAVYDSNGNRQRRSNSLNASTTLIDLSPSEDYYCGACAFNLTLRTYCVVVEPTTNASSAAPYVESSAFASCYFPFKSQNDDQDFFLNRSAKTHREQMPRSVKFIVRKSDDPFLAAQAITEGTMILQNKPLDIYLAFIMPTATFIFMGIVVFFIGVRVGRRRVKKDASGRVIGSGISGLVDSDDDDDDSRNSGGRGSGRFGQQQVRTVSGRLAVAVVVNSQNGESIPLLIDAKDYSESQKRFGGANNNVNNNMYNATQNNSSSVPSQSTIGKGGGTATPPLTGRRDSASRAQRGNYNNNTNTYSYDGSSSTSPRQQPPTTTFMTANDDGTVSIAEGTLSGVGGGGGGYYESVNGGYYYQQNNSNAHSHAGGGACFEPVGYGDEPIVTVTNVIRPAIDVMVPSNNAMTTATHHHTVKPSSSAAAAASSSTPPNKCVVIAVNDYSSHHHANNSSGGGYATNSSARFAAAGLQRTNSSSSLQSQRSRGGGGGGHPASSSSRHRRRSSEGPIGGGGLSRDHHRYSSNSLSSTPRKGGGGGGGASSSSHNNQQYHHHRSGTPTPPTNHAVAYHSSSHTSSPTTSTAPAPIPVALPLPYTTGAAMVEPVGYGELDGVEPVGYGDLDHADYSSSPPPTTRRSGGRRR